MGVEIFFHAQQSTRTKRRGQMKKLLAASFGAMLAISFASPAFCNPKDGEKAYMAELTKAIPADKIVSVDDLYKTWQDVQAGKSDAVILDIRTKEEFDAGHILGSNNVDSGHAYQMPGKLSDENREIWVFCRTQHRASYFASMLYNYGYRNVRLVKGGIVAWAEKGYPLVNQYLGEIKVVKYNNKLGETYAFREGH